ncbi:MAG: LuxR C-terminal-related transcriptional regulator, partial [Candidatus Acidiferrum sp.]
LTPREREVLPLVVSDLPNKQIAAEIGTSETTVKVHRGQLMRKLGADSLPELVRMADRIGIPTTKISAMFVFSPREAPSLRRAIFCSDYKATLPEF